MIIIGISGKKRSGKNTVAKLAALSTNVKTEEYAFADALKLEVAKICMVPVAEIEKNKDLYRHLLQAWGVYQRKRHGDDYWIKKVMQKIRVSDADVVFVTDVRFLNEADTLDYVGAHLVRVTRPDNSGDTHESEVALDSYDKFDTVILNCTTIDDLVPKVKGLLTNLKIQIKQ